MNGGLSPFFYVCRTFDTLVSNAHKPLRKRIMSKKNNKIAVIIARIGRIERKCDRLVVEVTSLRRFLTPKRSEIDEVIDRLHNTAVALRRQSRSERLYYLRNAREE